MVLAELATGSSGDSIAGVDVGEEGGRVLFDLLHVEALASVLAGLFVVDTGLKGTTQATDGVEAAVVQLLGVGEGDAVRKLKLAQLFIHAALTPSLLR